MWEKVRKEVREIGLVALYFLCWFAFFLSMKKLLLAQYDIDSVIYGTVIVSALVVAKVVVLLDKTSFGDRFRTGSLIAHVVWRSATYTAVVLVVTFAERVFDAYRKSGSLDTALSGMWAGRDLHHLLAMNISIGASFLAYNAFSEADRRLGPGTLRSILLSKRFVGNVGPESG